MTRLHLAIGLGLAFAAGPSSATIFTGSFHANEAQAINCSVGSTTEGPGTVTYDDQTGLFSWSFTFGNNAPDFDDGDLFAGGSQNAAHFHENVAPFPLEVNVGVGTPNVGSASITPTQADELLAGTWYLNIHSTECTSGELAGIVTMDPVVPIPGFVVPVLALTLAAGALGLRRLR